ncbi:hypothetical protein DFJ77DRAFT_447043 [Powellomyces hirtus]|nr:hypothetical protein DFJ77DRAFT_447043 [Powellomyces hirtus]
MSASVSRDMLSKGSSSRKELDPNSQKGNRLQIDAENEKFGSKSTVRLSVALPTLLGFIFAAIGIAVTLVWVNSEESLKTFSIDRAGSAIKTLANALLKQSGDRVYTSLGQNLENNDMLLHLTQRLQADGTFPRTRLDEKINFFFENLMLYSYISGMGYADEELGTYVSIIRDDNGSLQSEIMLNANATCTMCDFTATTPGTKAYYAVGMDGKLGAKNTEKPYDFRTRDWYRNATIANATIWTDPFPFTRGMIGISLVKPIYSKVIPGRVAGVFYLNVSLQPLSLFIQGMMQADGGICYMVDAQSRLLATSTNERMSDITTGNVVTAGSSVDPFVKGTFARLSERVGAGTPERIFEDEDYWFTFKRFERVGQSGNPDAEPAFNVMIVVGRDAEYYTATLTQMTTAFGDNIKESIRNSALITTAFILAGFLSIVSFVYLMLLRPFKALEASMLKATKFNFAHLTDEDAKNASRLTELNKLQFVFRQMISAFAGALRSNKDLHSASGGKRGYNQPQGPNNSGRHLADNVSSSHIA